ncbi:hypothetical protein FACS1894187_04510 [Synergistales bacterium]|nr:hypothetical protein FACS1894187_04510 [Synergistales bacterium]
MIEKKIYSSWAFKANENEKAAMNAEIHKELTEKHRVFRNDSKKGLHDGEDCNFADYDVIIGRSAQYKHALYHIHKNAPNLSIEELALLCDHGNLCFGYTVKGAEIYVSED